MVGKWGHHSFQATNNDAFDRIRSAAPRADSRPPPPDRGPRPARPAPTSFNELLQAHGNERGRNEAAFTQAPDPTGPTGPKPSPGAVDARPFAREVCPPVDGASCVRRPHARGRRVRGLTPLIDARSPHPQLLLPKKKGRRVSPRHLAPATDSRRARWQDQASGAASIHSIAKARRWTHTS